MNKLRQRRTLILICLAAILCPATLLYSQQPSPSPTPAPSQSPSSSPTPSPAPQARTIDTAELHQALLDLTNPFTVMCVAAHPDDEDGTTLTVLRRKFGVNTVSLFSTYGEGGQNAAGPELYEELGVIRARETLAAARIQGSEPYFLALKDFGFSKSAEEAFAVWGHDEALRRMVLKIRELRPDVIITNHDTSRGHGHHQATGRLILEAFDAAADPTRFPEQLAKVKPWQAQRLFVRISSSATSAGNPPATGKVVIIDPNEVDPVRKTSFGEQALAALQQHASQGPWPKTIEDMLRARRIEGGKLPLIRYALAREAPGVPALPDEGVPFIETLKVPASLSYRIAPFKTDSRLLDDYIDQPGVVLESLIEWRVANPTSASSPEHAHRTQLMEARFNKALALAAGVSLTIHSDVPVLIPRKKSDFSITLANAGDREITVRRVSFGAEKHTLKAAEQLLPDTETVITTEVPSATFTQLTVPKPEHLYDGLVFGRPYQAEAELEIDGAKFSVVDLTRMEVAPAIELLSVWPSRYLLTPATLAKPLSFKATVTNNTTAKIDADVVFRKANAKEAETGPSISLDPGETSEISVTSSIIPGANAPKRRATGNNLGVVGLEIRPRTLPAPAVMRGIPLIFTDARAAAGIRVGYVPSFDQTIERSLATLGVEASAINPAEIQNTDLSVYNTIVIDNRGYEAHPELITANSRFLEFVNTGGTLIVFYHKPNEWNPDPKKNRPTLSPYPFTIGEERVTDENALVRFLAPRHPLLNFPNRIRQADFADWIQERGLYYPKEWDNHYTALLSMNDKGEKPLQGGLLVAPYGKGQYIYTSMVWYRQLSAGLPGAYRMFANMISYR